MDDINLTEPWQTISSFKVSGGKLGDRFYGILDGNSHKITNLRNENNRFENGMFNMIAGCIKNLQIEAKIKYDTTEIPNGSCTVLAGANAGTIQNVDVIVEYQGVDRFA